MHTTYTQITRVFLFLFISAFLLFRFKWDTHRMQVKNYYLIRSSTRKRNFFFSFFCVCQLTGAQFWQTIAAFTFWRWSHIVRKQTFRSRKRFTRVGQNTIQMTFGTNSLTDGLSHTVTRYTHTERHTRTRIGFYVAPFKCTSATLWMNELERQRIWNECSMPHETKWN